MKSVNVVGAGLAGALLSLMLARRGFAVRLYDRRPDPRGTQTERGRSINLALATRGIRALEHAGVMDRIRPLLIPMRGRMIHEQAGATVLQPYGQREHEVVYSVGRTALNRILIEEVARHKEVTLLFQHTCLGAQPADRSLRLRDEISRLEYEVELAPTIATDGAGSAIRSSLAKAGYLQAREDLLNHGYKELTLPPVSGNYALEPHALHIWPRGGFMLIALPNTDRSFTATLFMAHTGATSFASLPDSRAVQEFFEREFADAVPLIPRLLDEFRAHPVGQLGTVHTAPWHVDGSVALLGDAAHAIVPFHGQGMNAAFEDCLAMDRILDGESDWASRFGEFERQRRPDSQAIAQMALENYIEMRDTVLDASFVRRKAIALELERRFPTRFIPRYSMVMFHPEIPYVEAQRRGVVQAEILAQLDTGIDDPARIDLEKAQRLIGERLSPLA